MKNKIVKIVLLFLIFFSFTNRIFANENEDRANAIFQGNFKSFFIGTIVEDDNKSFIINIEKTFMGEELERIQVKKFKAYTSSILIPTKGDIVVAILTNDGEIDDTWVFKATSTNYQTLYLANDNDPDNKDVILFQNYINSGEYIQDKEAIKKIEDKQNKKKEKKDVKIEEESKNSDGDKNVKNTTSDFTDFEKKSEVIFSFLKNPLKVIVVGCIFFVIVYVLKTSRNYRSDSEKDDFDEFDNK